MKFKLNELRRIIRSVILESEDRVYDDTVLPGEEADEELLAEPDLADQEERDDYIQGREARKSKKKRARLRSQEETEADMGDENTVAGGGMAGHIGGAWGPPQKPKRLKSKNAMGGKKLKSSLLDEYDE